MGCHAVCVLNESLELVVLCEGDDLQHSPELGENLEGRQHNQDGPPNTAEQRRSCPAHFQHKRAFTW